MKIEQCGEKTMRYLFTHEMRRKVHWTNIRRKYRNLPINIDFSEESDRGQRGDLIDMQFLK